MRTTRSKPTQSQESTASSSEDSDEANSLPRARQAPTFSMPPLPTPPLHGAAPHIQAPTAQRLVKRSSDVMSPRAQPVLISPSSPKSQAKAKAPVKIGAKLVQETGGTRTQIQQLLSTPAKRSKLRKIKILRELKTDGSKMVLLVEFNGVPQALKIVTGADSPKLRGNVCATRWIRALGLPGVAAPEMLLLQDTDMDAATKAWAGYLNDPDNPRGKLTDSAFKDFIQNARADRADPRFRRCGMTADPAPGFTLEVMQCFYPDTFKPMESTDELGSTTEARKEIAALLARFSKTTPTILSAFESQDYGTCFARVCAWQVRGQPKKEKAAARLKFLLSVLQVPEALQFVEESQPLWMQCTNLRHWLGTEAGSKAMIAMACTDLVLGMEDRVLTRYHAGNFAYGNGALWCIDNAKEGPHLLVGDSDDANLARFKGWTALSCLQLNQKLHQQLVATGLWQGRPSPTITQISVVLAGVLKRFLEVANNAHAPVDEHTRERIKQRVVYLQERLRQEREAAGAYQDCLQQAMLLDSPTAMESMTWFTKASRLRFLTSTTVQESHAAKHALREAKSVDQLREAVKLIDLEGLKRPDDPASKKAAMELAATDVVLTLSDLAASILATGLVPTQAVIDGLAQVVDAWIRNTDTGLSGSNGLIAQAHEQLTKAVELHKPEPD